MSWRDFYELWVFSSITRYANILSLICLRFVCTFPFLLLCWGHLLCRRLHMYSFRVNVCHSRHKLVCNPMSEIYIIACWCPIVTNKSSSLKKVVTSPGMQVTLLLGLMPVEIWTYSWITKWRINRETFLCIGYWAAQTSAIHPCRTFSAYLHGLVFENSLNGVIREHSTRNILVYVHCEDCLSVPCSLFSQKFVNCYFQMQIHFQLKPVTICSYNHMSASGRTLYTRRKDY